MNQFKFRWQIGSIASLFAVLLSIHLDIWSKLNATQTILLLLMLILVFCSEIRVERD